MARDLSYSPRCKPTDFSPWEGAKKKIPKGSYKVYYGPGYEPTECNFPELWKKYDHLEVDYGAVPFKIERTNTPTAQPPPERTCRQQKKDWKSGYLVAAVPCHKDDTYYWVYWPAKLVKKKEKKELVKKAGIGIAGAVGLYALLKGVIKKRPPAIK